MKHKFKTSKKVWIASCKFQLEHKLNSEEAGRLFQIALKTLEAHKHVMMISKFGQLEYEFGSIERGRTIFESLLSSYPKKLDLWNVYLDKEIKFCVENDKEHVRSIFHRLIHMKFSAKKMKFVFKKFMAFEAKHGTEAQVEHVKTLVQTFVDTAN